jgi:hypothetical protein
MRVFQEPDHLDSRAPLVIGGITLLSIVLGVGATLGVRAWAQRDLRHSQTDLASRAPLTRERIEGQLVGLFERDRARVSGREAPVELEQYGWIDRERGLVRIPISRAKALYLERRREQLGGGSR